MAAAEQWVSLRAYARHRGVALSAVQKAIASGRVTAVKKDGTRIVGIDLVAADGQWLENTDPDQAARTKGLPESSLPAAPLTLQAPPGPAPAAAAPGSDEPVQAAVESKGKDFGYLEERAKREKFAAAQAELDYLKAIGQLVPTAELRAVTAQRYRAIRDKILGIADRLASILAAEKDPARVHAALTKEIKQVLHELSDDARAEAARGAAERVAA